MSYLVYIVVGSLILNAYLAFRLYIKKANILTVDAKALLNDITSGGATVKIQVLDTGALFYRSPKG